MGCLPTELDLGNVAVARLDRQSPAGARVTQPIPHVLLASILIILLGSTWGPAASAQDAKLVVFAAASLKDAPVDAVIIGIVDVVDVLGKQIYNAKQ